MTARPMMVVLAGSMMLAPLALALDHAVSRGGGGEGGSSMQSNSGSGGGGNAGQSMGSSSGGSQQSYQPSPSQPASMATASDHAVSRGGGGGTSSRGGSSSSGGSSSHARGGSGSGSHPSHGTRPGGPGSTAERRHPRAGTGSGGHGGSGGGYYPYYPYYGYGYGYGYGYYPGWGWGSYWWPNGSYYDGWYGGGYWGYPYGGWAAGHAYAHHDLGSVRVLVDPSEARVYVDGYYAGTVDDFDGLFQRLNASPGRHEITLKLEGYKTHRVKVYVPFESTLKVHYDMEKGSGETFEDLSTNVPERELARERQREREESAQREENEEDVPGPAMLRLHVTPPDASVYVDGAFRGTAREAEALQLPPGRHKLEIVRPGYRTVEREVSTAVGEPTDLTIELDKTTI